MTRVRRAHSSAGLSQSLNSHIRPTVSVSTTELWQELKKEYSSEDITQHSVLQYLNVMVSRSSLCVPLPSLIILYFNNATGSGADHPEEDERR